MCDQVRLCDEDRALLREVAEGLRALGLRQSRHFAAPLVERGASVVCRSLSDAECEAMIRELDGASVPPDDV
jgi:hypothetical protein